MPDDTKFEISLKILNEIGAYLGKRPFEEVAQLFTLISGLKVIVPPVATPPVAVAVPEVKAE